MFAHWRRGPVLEDWGDRSRQVLPRVSRDFRGGRVLGGLNPAPGLSP